MMWRHGLRGDRGGERRFPPPAFKGTNHEKNARHDHDRGSGTASSAAESRTLERSETNPG
jgi:hypothetical protein